MSAGGPGPGDVALACATLLVDELVRAGAAGAFVCPGSRSAPIALALSRHGGLPVFVHLDERSAGFAAQGLAKATGRIALVACTSGTAVANLLPAVVEASRSRAPLVLLTADRPPELRDAGANQTIDQANIFGGFARWFADPGVPEAGPAAGEAWRSLGARAARAALGFPAGPVHLNLPFREPLVPAGAAVDLGPAGSGREDGGPWERASSAVPAASEDDLGWLAEPLGGVERGAVVAGALDAGPRVAAIAALAVALGWPLLAEPLSGLRLPGAALAAGQHLLADQAFADAHRPDLVLQVGATPTTRAAQAFAMGAERLVTISPPGFPADPAHAAERAVRGDPAATAEALLERLGPRGAGPWLRAWLEADRAARAAVDACLDERDEPFEGRLARDVAAAPPPRGALVIGSSMPVRDLDAFMAPRPGLRVIGNRGASGIDGFVSTVLGVAAAGAPTVGLCGDLSVLHDASGLVWGARRGAGAVIVVANNGGGGVFDLLPQASLPEHEELFVTPHRIDLGALAGAAGARHVRVERAGEVPAAMARAAAAGGMWIVEVPVDRALALRRREAVRAAVRSALGPA